MKKPLLSFFIFLAIFTWSGIPDSHATENGSGVYLLGSGDIKMAIVPSRGVYFRTDLIYATGKFESFRLNGINYNNLDSWITTSRSVLSIVPKGMVFRGRYMIEFEFLLGHHEYTGELDINGGGKSRKNDSQFGLGDLKITPFAIGWDENDIHLKVSLPFYLPTGSYDPGRLANIGRNHFAVDPTVAFTWYQEFTMTELSVQAGLTINARNAETDYRNGEELHVEFSFLQGFERYFGLGAVGYAYYQVSPDRGEGAMGAPSRVMSGAIGPAFTYTVRQGRTQFNLITKVYLIFGDENHFISNSYWLGVGFKF